MSIIKIDIGTAAYKNINEVSTRDGVSPVLINGYKDESGSDIKRPGLKTLCTLGTGQPIMGLYWSKQQRLFYAVSAGNVYKVSIAGTTTLVGFIGNSGKRASFTEDGTRVFIANGGPIYYTTGTSLSTCGGTPPTNITSLSYLDGYIIASNSAYVYFADDITNWSALDFFQPEFSYDNLVGTCCFQDGTIHCISEDSMDVYYNDGVTPFSKYRGAANKTGGCSSRATITYINGTLMWLNQDKKVIMLNGSNPQMISGQIDKELQTYASVRDSYAYRLNILGRDFYIISFPVQNATWVYDVTLGIWYPWHSLEATTDNYKSWEPSCQTYVPDWNKQLLGSNTTDKIYEVSPDYTNDNGSVIRFSRRTGNTDHGTFYAKILNEIGFKTQRGSGFGYNLSFTSGGTKQIMPGDTIVGATSGASAKVDVVTLQSGAWAGGSAVGDLMISFIAEEFQSGENLNIGSNNNVATTSSLATFVGNQTSKMIVRWRNNGGEWKQEHLVSLGRQGQNEHIARLTHCGRYRTRQWEIIHTDDAPFELTNPIEGDVEVVR